MIEPGLIYLYINLTKKKLNTEVLGLYLSQAYNFTLGDGPTLNQKKNLPFLLLRGVNELTHYPSDVKHDRPDPKSITASPQKEAGVAV